MKAINFERRLISKATYETNYEEVFAAGITAEMFFEPESQKLYRYAEEFYKKYRRSPTPRVIKLEFPDYKLLDEVEEPLGYCIQRVHQDYLQRSLDAAGDRIADALEAKDPAQGFEIMAEVIKSAGSLTPEPALSVNIADKLEDYLEIWMSRAGKSEIIGIPTGFRTFNRATLGFQAAQLITVAGLAGAGKSTLLMLMAQHIHKAGHMPYFMSFEMSEEEQVARYAAMGAGLNYNDIVSGRIKLDDAKKNAVRTFAAEALERGTFTLCTDIARASTVSGLEVKLREYTPDVCFIDGVYLMHDQQTKKSGADWQAMTNITRDLKQLAQRLEIPIVIATQALVSKTFSKGKGIGRKLDMYSPGYSSSFAQDSDVMFGLEVDDRKPDQRLVRLMKGRHCPKFAMWIEWDWDEGRFGTEFGVEEGEVLDLDDERRGEYDDDEP